MTTSVTIPHFENQDKNLLLLFGFLKDSGYITMSDIGEKLGKIRNGKDISFDIPTNHLPFVLKRISDDGFIYKPDTLKELESKQLSGWHIFAQANINESIAEIIIHLNQTHDPNHSVIISDQSLSLEEKQSITESLHILAKRIPQSMYHYMIDVYAIKYHSLKLPPDKLTDAIWQQISNFFNITD